MSDRAPWGLSIGTEADMGGAKGGESGHRGPGDERSRGREGGVLDRD